MVQNASYVRGEFAEETSARADHSMWPETGECWQTTCWAEPNVVRFTTESDNFKPQDRDAGDGGGSGRAPSLEEGAVGSG